MKHVSYNVFRCVTAMLLVCSLLVGACVPAFAAGVADVNDDGVINYVSLGASNANGYGLEGYLPVTLEDFMNNPDPNFKNTINVYGYKMAPVEAYPAKVKAELESRGMDVELTQLAISSMRAEELRVLLDNDYYGDSYTSWRFIKDNGTGWFNSAEKGGVDALRKQYQEAIANADLVTVDIGVNNFGVYSINRITSGGKFADADFSNVFNDEELAKLTEARAKIEAYIFENTDLEEAIVNNPALAEQLDLVIETFAYALTGFCVSFDRSMEKIYELNPDVNVVVVSIQNLLSGVTSVFPGVDGNIPLGDIYGAVVNMANVYTAVGSPYANTYNYAFAGENGHATTFLDEIRDYSGDPADLTHNMTDCFDMYDNDMYVSMRMMMLFDQLYGAQLAQVGMTTAQFLKLGAAGQLPAEYLPYYQVYLTAVNTAYDVVATIMQAGAKITNVDISIVSDAGYGRGQKVALGYIESAVMAAVQKAVADPTYSFDFANEPVRVTVGGETVTLTGTDLVNDPVYSTVLGMGVRFDIGNSFYAHPNVEGHDEIRDAILKALDEDIMGYEVAIEEALKLLNQAYDYAEKNGYIDMLKAEIEVLKERLATESDEVAAELEAAIAKLNAELEKAVAESEAELAALKAEIEAQINHQIAVVEAEIEALKAELKKAVEEANAQLQAEIQAKIDELEAKAEALKAELEAQINYQIAVVEAKIAAVKAEVEAKIAAAKAEAEAKIDELKAEAEAKKAQLEAEINAAKAEAQAKIDAVKAVVEAEVDALEADAAEAYQNATTGEYTVSADSYYVAIGDSDAAGLGAEGADFGELLAEELGLDLAAQYAELTDEMCVSELRALLDAEDELYVSEIEKADLITVSMNKDNYTPFAFGQIADMLMGKKPAEMDWAQYLGDDGAELMDKAFAEMAVKLAEQGVDEALIPMATLLVESYAFGYADFAFNYAEVLNKIHAINPDALVVVVGAYNPLNTLVVEDVAIGEYLDYVIALSDAHYLAYAMMTDNTVFVAVPDTTTVADADAVTIETYIASILDPTQFHADDAGHEYIKNEILNALTVTVEEEPPVVEPEFDKGDVDMSGAITIQDAVQAYYYVNGKVELSDEAIALADVAEPVGTVNIQDAVVLYYFVNGKIDTL